MVTDPDAQLATATLSEPFYRFGEQFAIDLPTARVVFTTRRGGVSRGPYSSLNLGRLTDDAVEAVAHNRTTLEAELGVALAFTHQVHGPEIHELTPDGAARDRGADSGALPRADGQFTVHRGLAPAVLTADCLAIAVAGEGGVAMLHAGWKGLRAGVIAAGVAALRGAGAGGPLSAAIGPGAGPCCYEVGGEVHSAFADRPAHVHRGANLDLPAIACHDLAAAGVETVDEIGLCTICSDPALFYSHRRDHGITGRQVGIAWSS
jgi:YfiH family protein